MREVTIGWEEATPTWRTARLTVRRGDAEVVVFEDAGELVLCLPPHHSHPHPPGHVDARRTGAALLRMVGLRP